MLSDVPVVDDATTFGVCLDVARRQLDDATDHLRDAEDRLALALADVEAARLAAIDAADLCDHATRVYARAQEAT